MNWSSVQRGKKFFALGRLGQPRQDKNLLYRHEEPNEPIKKGHLSFVLFWVPICLSFHSQRGPPLSIVSLAKTSRCPPFQPTWAEITTCSPHTSGLRCQHEALHTFTSQLRQKLLPAPSTLPAWDAKMGRYTPSPATLGRYKYLPPSTLPLSFLSGASSIPSPLSF
jgi:hypothetical protein